MNHWNAASNSSSAVYSWVPLFVKTSPSDSCTSKCVSDFSLPLVLWFPALLCCHTQHLHLLSGSDNKEHLIMWHPPPLLHHYNYHHWAQATIWVPPCCQRCHRAHPNPWLASGPERVSGSLCLPPCSSHIITAQQQYLCVHLLAPDTAAKDLQAHQPSTQLVSVSRHVERAFLSPNPISYIQNTQTQ